MLKLLFNSILNTIFKSEAKLVFKLRKLCLPIFCIALCMVKFSYADEVISIAASPVPHAEILKQAKLLLKKDKIDLQIKEFNDYIQPNLLVAQKQLDANFFQHIPYLTQFNKERNTNLVSLVAVEIEPMGLYANKADNLLQEFIKTHEPKALKNKNNPLIGVPNDTTNEGRALLLLQKNNFLTLKKGVVYPTKKDIVNNPYNLQVLELDPAMLPRALAGGQLSLAVINSNYALDAKLNPIKDSIVIEDANSPYVNIIAVRPEDKSSAKMQKLLNVMQSKEIKEYINSRYNGAIISVIK